MRTYVFRKYLRDNETVCKTVFGCSYGAHVEFNEQKIVKKSRNTVPLTPPVLVSVGATV